MINIALRSEFSFQKVLSKIDRLITSQEKCLGIADDHNTFSHCHLRRICEKQGKKPIFGARVMAVRNPMEKVRPRGQFGSMYILLAKNLDGLHEIYKMIQRSTECFYYRNHVGLTDIWGLSENVIVICESFSIPERIDYLGVSFNTPKILLEKCTLPRVALNANKYISVEDRETYEIFAGRRRENSTYPGHLLTELEWMVYFDDKEAVANTYKIADDCNCSLVKSETLSYVGQENLEQICIDGAKELGVDLTNPEYSERMQYELKMINDKNFKDYFLIVSDMVRYAKRYMLVGPGRGSSGGSLVCFLSGITAVDPIKHRLLFQRFMSPDRIDEPDIDIDFPDKHRKIVIDMLVKKYGSDRVRHVATIMEMKVKGTLREFAKELRIPLWEIDAVSTAMVTRSTADVRYDYCIEDTLKTTEAGNALLQKYPKMALCGRVEGHARTSGVHAAGIIVSKDPLVHFGGINERNGALMLDKHQAEYMNLLKIDCLGLTTMTILQECAELAGFDYHDFYTLPLDDDNVLKIFREDRLRGVFQFEGFSLKNLAGAIRVTHIEDLVAITALARPGPLHGGTTHSYVSAASGKKEIEYLINHPIMIDITKHTLGAVIYQEQLMEVLQKIGDMSWDDIEKVRRVVSKRSGKEKFNTFKDMFVKGAANHDMDPAEVESAWESLLNFGAYGFNRSHAVAYAIISYWTAWAKVYYPKEFLAAFLNNTETIADQLRILREMTERSGIKFIPLDPDRSTEKWHVENGILLGPLTNVKGIGAKTAKKIVDLRSKGKLPPKGIIAKLIKCETELDVLYPCQEYWGGLFDDPEMYDLPGPPTKIVDIHKKGKYTFVAKLMHKNVRDLNEAMNVSKRGGEIFTEDTFLMNLNFEDDTDSLMGRISRKDFTRLAPDIVEFGREEIDWYLVKGDIISDDIRFFFIKAIHRLGDGINERL